MVKKSPYFIQKLLPTAKKKGTAKAQGIRARRSERRSENEIESGSGSAALLCQGAMERAPLFLPLLEKTFFLKS